MTPLPTLHPKAARARVATIMGLIALIAVCIGWEWLWAPLRPGGSWLVVKALPLALALPGLLKNRLYSYRWLSLLLWLYVTEGLVRAWGDKAPGNFLAMAEVALSVAVFAAATVYIRTRLKAGREHAAE